MKKGSPDYRLDKENKGKENEILQSQRNERMVVMPFFKTIKLRQLLNSSFCLSVYKLCIHHHWLLGPHIFLNFSQLHGSLPSVIPHSSLHLHALKKCLASNLFPEIPTISSFQSEFLFVKSEMTAYISNTWLPPPSFLYLSKWQFHPSDQNTWSHLNSSFLY